MIITWKKNRNPNYPLQVYHHHHQSIQWNNFFCKNHYDQQKNVFGYFFQSFLLFQLIATKQNIEMRGKNSLVNILNCYFFRF